MSFLQHQLMMILLIPLFLILTLSVYSVVDGKDFRADSLKTFLSTFFLIGLSTEMLSLANQLNRKGLLITWILFNIVAASILIYAWFKKPKSENNSFLPEKNAIKNFLRIRGIYLVLILIAIITTLYIALKAPPNNFDSMTYHMARIPHWIQNQSIRYYPTAIERQNYSMPLAEFAILHLQVLSKSDLFANLVQWFSFVLSILTVSLIAKQLKVSPRGQWISAGLAALIPMAILQSSSTQNDLVVGIFCLGFFYFLKKAIQDREWKDAIFASLALGLALATKGTAYILCAGIGLGLGTAALFGKKLPEIKALSVRFSAVIIIALLLNSGVFLRNWNLYHHPILTNNERTIVEKVSPGILFANLTRNGAVHLASPIQPLNDLIEHALDLVLGSQAQNPASTFQESEFKLIHTINEDESGNLLHFILLSASLILYFFLTKHKNRAWTIFMLTIILSIILFSLAFKWQPWVARLQTPIFLLGCVVIGWLLDLLIKKNTWLNLILLICFLASIPYLVNNSNRPLLPLWEDNSVFYDAPWKEETVAYLKKITDPIPFLSGKVTSVITLLTYGRSIETIERQELYFMGNYDEYHWYRKAFRWIEDDPSTTIGLLMDENDYEYPFWVLFGQYSSPGKRLIYHVGVDNISGSLENPMPSRPELIIITRKEYNDLPVLADYTVVYESDTIQMYKLANR